MLVHVQRHVGGQRRRGRRRHLAQVGLDRLDRDAVALRVAPRGLDRPRLDVDREHRIPAEPRGGDRDHTGAAAEVGEAAVRLQPQQQLEASCASSGARRCRTRRGHRLDDDLAQAVSPGGSGGERTRSRPATSHAWPARRRRSSAPSPRPPPRARAARRRRARRAPRRSARRRRTRPRPARRRARARRRPAGAAASARRARPRPPRRAASGRRASRQPRLGRVHRARPGRLARGPPAPARGAPPPAAAAPPPPRARPGCRPRAQRSRGLERLAARAAPAARTASGPAQPCLQRALAAARAPRPADRRAELHHRLVPRRRAALGQQLGRPPRERPRRPADAVAALDHPAHVGVDRRHLRVPRERGDGRGGVRPDARAASSRSAGQPSAATTRAAACSASARRL